MTPFDRQVRGQIYRHMVASGSGPSAQNLAEQRGWDPEEVAEALGRLHKRHLIAMTPDASRVRMAHPFSGVETLFRSQVGDRSWFANCAWDALAILALMGDGAASQSVEGNEMKWTVTSGVVSPKAVIHIAVPPPDSGTTSFSLEAPSRASGRRPRPERCSTGGELHSVTWALRKPFSRCPRIGTRHGCSKHGTRLPPNKQPGSGPVTASRGPSGIRVADRHTC